jgi:hypothetical protein
METEKLQHDERAMYPWDAAWLRRKAGGMRLLKPAEGENHAP